MSPETSPSRVWRLHQNFRNVFNPQVIALRQRQNPHPVPLARAIYEATREKTNSASGRQNQ